MQAQILFTNKTTIDMTSEIKITPGRSINVVTINYLY